MTSTIGDISRNVAGNKAERFVTLTISSYATGGETISASALGMSGIDIVGAISGSYGAFPVWDKTNGKLKLMSAAATEVTAAVNAGVWYLRVTGYP